MKMRLALSVFVITLLACNLLNPDDRTPVDFPTPTLGTVPSETPISLPVEETTPTPAKVLVTETVRPTEDSGLPSGQTLYTTKFDDLVGWQHFPWWRSSIQNVVEPDFRPQIASYGAEIRKGDFHLVMPKRYSNIAAVYQPDLASPDVRINTLAKFTLVRPWTFISLMCRYSDAGWYEFYIYADGLWGILKITAGEGNYYLDDVMIEEDTSLVNNNETNAINDITATCEGNLLTLSLNGVQMGSVQDDTHTDGLTGVGAAAGEQGNSQVDFLELQVTVP